MAKSEIDTKQIYELLNSSKIDERKKAVKSISENNLSAFGDDLFNLYDIEKQKGKSWEFIVEIIKCLGKLKFSRAVDEFNKICIENKEHDMITSEAACSLCLITKKSESDVDTEMRLLKFGKFSVVDGALNSLRISKSNPSDEEKNIILTSVEKFEPKKEKGYSDVRMGLASCCAGWLNFPRTLIFLHECLDSGYSPLVKVANSALKGKYL